MTLTRGIPLSVHGAIGVVAGPAIMVAPFVLGFGALAGIVAVAFGAVTLGLAFQIGSPGRGLRLSAHAGLDYLLAVVAIGTGLGIAIGGGSASEAVFLVGIGAAQVALTAMTRFSSIRSA